MDCEKSTQTNKSHFILHNDKRKCFFFIKVFPITILFSLLRMSRLKVDQKLIEFFVKLNRQKILHITCMQICCNTAWHNHFLKPHVCLFACFISGIHLLCKLIFNHLLNYSQISTFSV